MAKAATSSDERHMANGVSWQRYGRDLAYLMKRLDKMDEAIQEQQMNLSDLVLLVSPGPKNRFERQQAKPAAEKRGNCRVIQFSADRSM